jgi:hypothetical protein
MKLQDYLHYYLHGKIWEAGVTTCTLMGIGDSYYTIKTKQGTLLTLSNRAEIKLVLRRLEDMTEQEIISLLQSMVPTEMEDKPSDEEYGIELFRNDGGNLVDADALIGAAYTCRCYEGQISIKKCGTICAYDETGTEQELVNGPKAYHYLLTQHFDLFGLIDAGLAIDTKSL